MKIAYIATPLRVDDSYSHSSEHLFRSSGGNTGNFAFVHAIHSHLGDDFDLVPWHIHPDQVRERYDLVVIACANQLGSHTDLGGLADNLEKMNVPVVALGLGAQSGSADKDVTLSDGTRRWVEVIADRAPSSAPNIGMRGAFSLRQLELIGLDGRAAVTGCPSNLINCDPELPEKLAARYALQATEHVAVPAGLHLWTHLKELEQQLAEIVDLTKGSYVSQSELDMIRLTRGEFSSIDENTFHDLHQYIRPSVSAEEFKLWCRRHGAAFKDASSWMEAMRNFDFVVGPRFHGVMLAIQAGTPGGVIAHDSRTYELCSTLGIPVRHYYEVAQTGITVENVRPTFSFDANAYAERRLALGRVYANILTSAGIKIAASLSNLLQAG